MAAGPDIGGEESTDALRRQLATAIAERDEARAERRAALEWQTATAEVLAVINASPGNLAPVFAAILERSRRLCDAAYGDLWIYDGTVLHLAATQGEPAFAAWLKAQGPVPVWPGSPTELLIQGADHIQYEDPIRDGQYAAVPEFLAQVERAGVRSSLFVPLWKDGTLAGVVIVYRTEVRRFSPEQIGVLQGFAAQAVIAMENARLLNEQREALEQQTATADILRAISQSPTDVTPVLEAVVKAARRFCGARDVVIGLRDGDEFLIAAHDGPLDAPTARRRLDRSSTQGRAVLDARTVHVPDFTKLDPAEWSKAIELSQTYGFNSAVAAPMLRDGKAIGTVFLRRPETGPFAPQQIALLESFAAQAVIALENVRLFTELRDSLDQQTATADILRVISQSPTDVKPVLDAVVRAAVRFCGAEDAVIFLREGDTWRGTAHEGPMGAPLGIAFPLHRDTAPGRSMLDAATVQYPDTEELDPVEHAHEHEASRRMGFRAVASAPMLRDGIAIGAVGLRRKEAGAFTPRQIALLEAFAAQAVIALENVRLFTELKESLDQQTATAEILRVISQSPTDVKPVLDAVAKASVRFCGALDSVIFLREGDRWKGVAHEGPLGFNEGRLSLLNRETAPGRAMVDRRTIHYPDISLLDSVEHGTEQANARRLGFSAVVAAPLLRDDDSIGGIALRRKDAGAFTPRQIELLENFAAQAVIAIENVRLFTELKETLDQQTATSDILRVISQSPEDVSPVLSVMVKAAQRFCGAEDVVISLRDGDELVIAAHDGPILKPPPRRALDRSTAQGRAMVDGTTIHLPDVERIDRVEWSTMIALTEKAGVKAILAAPMMRDGAAVGAIMLRRREAGVFTERQIALLESFAAQAVIAIENVRLFSELRESLDQQTATAEILRVIAQSPTDVAPVLEAVAKAALRFCGAEDVAIDLRDGEIWRCVAHAGILKSPVGMTNPIGRKDLPGRTMLDRKVTEIPDVAATTDEETAFDREVARQVGFRAALSAPMLGKNEALGALILHRTTPGAFSDRQIALLENFAAQSVVALENVRLFTELKESLDRQTATAEVLETINRSQGDLQPMFDAIVSKAMTLCDAAFGMFNTFDGERFNTVSTLGVPEAYARYRLSGPPDYSPDTAPGRLIAGEDCVSVDDMLDSDVYRRGDPNRRSIVDLGGARSTLNVALRRDKVLLGMIVIYRREVRPFTEKEVALLQNFAGQAVIAMENARLLSELRESLDYQTATSELLDVISRSTTDIQPVFDTMLASAIRLCGVEKGDVAILQGDVYRHVAFIGCDPEELAWLKSRVTVPGRGTSTARALLERRTDHVLDQSRDPERIAPKEATRERTTLAVPLLRDGQPLGVISLLRDHVEPFTERQIALIETFADQAVIAMENARLLSELTQRTDDLTQSLEYQTATSELLEVISRSASDIQPVLDTMLASAARLCGATLSGVVIRHGGAFRYRAVLGGSEEARKVLYEIPILPGRETVAGRVLMEGKAIHVTDLANDPEYTLPAIQAEARTILGVPLLRDGEPVGVISLTRGRVETFTERQIALVRTFADQAVIAMENARLLGELRESLDQQTATAEILQVINTSPGNLIPVFRAILEKAHSSCGADMGSLFSWDGTHIRAVVTMGYDAEIDEILRTPQPAPRWVTDMVSGGQRFQHRTLEQERTQQEAAPFGPRFAAGSGIRTNLIIPLRKDEVVLGFISANRREVRPYTDKEIALLENFAAQAVIAMENARLLGELTRREEELRVTFDHMGDGVAMFDAGLKLASWNRNFQELLDIPDVFLAGRPSLEDYVRLLIRRGELGQDDPDGEIARYRERAGTSWSMERTRPDGRILEIRNNPVPGGGAVLIYSDITERKQAEAAIAAARDAAEAALERQTATADILKVIASSPTDVQPVLDVVVKAAIRFCGATDVNIHMRDGDSAVLAAHEGALRATIGDRVPLNRETGFGTAMIDRVTVHRPDILALDPVEFATAHRYAREYGFRAVLVVPLLREGTAIGAISLRRVDPGVYTPQQIDLLETFAAQAVIAVENVRLFTELRESLERQTATADILKVIASSPTDVGPVMTAVARAALRFCGATDSLVHLREGDKARLTAHEGNIDVGPLGMLLPLTRDHAVGRAIVDAAACHIPDYDALDPADWPTARALSRDHGHKAGLAVPMLRENTAVGSIMLRKPAAEPFTPSQIQLLETFAAQAVIAIENVRLFTELRDSLGRLQAAQANLIQSEKMASLGQLTAGIAHEIKNPLNFVNNFATLSVDLLDELKEVAGPALATLDEDKRAELDETMELLTGNLGKIAEHGKRADGIVKSMLSHSRGGAGDWAAADINALVEEALNLAYHGARSQDKEFNVTLERDLGKAGAPIEVVPQDVTRVFLNLFGNGFYAANKRRLAAKEPGFRPTLKVSTRDLGDTVEVRVRDNGIGMSPEVKEKLFQPFFTTKPTGEGTGLGLSISYDIVTQQHGGTIEVTSEPNDFTEFTIRLPRARRVVEAARGNR